MKKWIDSWHVKDIILIAFIGIICGIIAIPFNYLYDFLLPILTPMGLAPFANEILFGSWIIPGPLAAFLIRKPGAATLGGFAAAVVEMVLGGQFGVITLVAGIIQGFGSEVGFAIRKYRKYNFKTLLIVCLTTTVITFAYDMFKEQYLNYPIYYILGLIIVRFISILVFVGVIVYFVNKLAERSNLLRK